MKLCVANTRSGMQSYELEHMTNSEKAAERFADKSFRLVFFFFCTDFQFSALLLYIHIIHQTRQSSQNLRTP